MIFQRSVSGVIYYVVFSFRRLLFQPHVCWQYSIFSKSVRYVTTSTYHRNLIKENIITKLQKLYSPPRNSRAGNKSPALFVKKPLCMGDLSLARKIFIERPVTPSEKICFIIFNESPLKMTKKKFFFFQLKSSFRSQDIYFFPLTSWSCRKNSFKIIILNLQT